MKQFDVDSLAVADRYKLLIGCIVPRPIAFVSTVAPDGRLNLAPFSFFCGVGSNPMTVAFCPANRAEPDADGSWEKDSLRNAKPIAEGGTGQFVVNASVEAYERRMAAAAEPLPHGESEFELAGLTPTASVKVRPPRVLESPWAFECETMQVVRTNPTGASAGNLVLGRVVFVHVREEIINERFHIDPERLRAVGRMGGLSYTRTRDRFEMPMGRAALE